MQAFGLLPILSVMLMGFDQTQFMLWGSLYVFLKWTIGLWALRRAKEHLAQRRDAPMAH